MSEKFNKLEELYDNITNGGEIEFCYNDKFYSITTSDKGIHFMEQYNYETEQIFSDPTQIGEYKLQGKSFSEIYMLVDITFRCF